MTVYQRMLLLVLCVAPMMAIADESGQTAFDKAIHPFLSNHCLDCHGEDLQEARIRFDRLTGFAFADRHLWTKVHEVLRVGEMPPEDHPQPTAEEKASVLRWIETEQRSIGAGSTRRLNRRELSNALQDLTGLAVNYVDALPGDGKLAGFDTGASALQDAESSVDQVMQVTRRAVDGIRFLEPSPAVVLEADLRDVKDSRKALDHWKQLGASPKTRGYGVPGTGLLLETKWLGERGGLELYVPTPASRRGLVKMTLVVAHQKYFDGLPNPHLWITIGGKVFDYREVTGTTEAPQELVYVAQLEDVGVGQKGVKIELSSKVEVPYGVKGFQNEDKSKPDDKIPGGQSLFRPAYDKKQRSPERIPVPFVVLQNIRIEANHVAFWPPEGWGVDVGDPTDDLGYARQLLGLFIERAWRRRVDKAEAKRFLALYEKLREQGLPFDDALRATFHSVTLSPPFRYLKSPNATSDQHEHDAIASRLSFMLWGSPPDKELRRLAAERKLRDPSVLGKQVDRLLQDPRSDAFVRPFVTQWLEMEQPITIVQNHLAKQDFRFGRHLKASMKEETIAYVRRLLRENRPARELIHSDWTMMNESLANHYGYEDIDGAHLRPVKLKKDDPRGGGILGQAGIQSMLCWMGDNWVIYRGAWALRHILDDPPPPPPLEVPELDPDAGNNRGKTFKELLVQHQENKNCAVCHKHMDPLGFAFQNFDVSGRWRSKEYDGYSWGGLDGKKVWKGVGKSRPVDVSGNLPRGEEFTNYTEFKDALLKGYVPDLTRGLLKNLLIYSTGRKPDVDDLAEIRAIMKTHQANGYPLGSLLKGVIQSQAFLDH